MLRPTVMASTSSPAGEGASRASSWPDASWTTNSTSSGRRASAPSGNGAGLAEPLRRGGLGGEVPRGHGGPAAPEGEVRDDPVDRRPPDEREPRDRRHRPREVPPRGPGDGAGAGHVDAQGA